MLVGGEEESFEAAMLNLKRSFPVLVIDGSGKAADFICKGLRMGMNNSSEEFKSELIEAAKMVYGSNDEKSNTIETKCEMLITDLQDEMAGNSKSIHMYSVHDTSYTLDRTIQDILFDVFYLDEKNEDKLTDNILHFVDLWNRPDIAEKKIFKLENSKVLEKLQKKLCIKESKLSKLFTNALKDDRIDLVRQVLEYILDKELYKTFLDHSLEGLYEDKTLKQKKIVDMINDAVSKILGSEEMKPFEKGDEICIDDIFKHLFIWAVLMNRRDLAMLFWKRDGDYICSALFASSLAKRLADNASAEAFMNEQTALWESSRHYEDLAYSVMTELYLNDRKHARQLLVTEVKRYNSTTIFEITEKFSLMNFMGHAACQTKLNKIWKGQMKGDTSNLKAIAFAVTFLPILKWDILKLEKPGKRAKVTQSERLGTKEKMNNTTCLQSVPNWIRKIYYFYNAPLIKFLFSVLTYLAMLVAFSFFVLTDLHPTEEKFPSIYEYIVYAWAASSLTEEIRQSLVQLKDKIKLSDFLKKAIVLHTNKNKRSEQRHMSSDDDIMEEDEESEEEEEEEEECMMADDDAFTTEWDLKVARKKKRWAQKEAEIRDQMKKAKLSQGASSMDKKPPENIFTSNAAAGILTNDLVRIMEEEQELSFTAEPIDDNIYNWRVKIFHFDAECGLAEDLLQIQSKFGYNYIELEMTFEIDLYPFYPPLVKVMRPRLQCSMMQRVTNMEMLKLSYWIPTKDMKSVIQDIKTFLQQWARLEVNSPRNDLLKYPYGAYVEIEHHLLTLALVSEVNPRVNYLYDMDISQLTEQRTNKPNTPVSYERWKFHRNITEIYL
ncbi:baculoviral IAP repeat-containing protein 6 (apollon) [Mytilus galloprovincialis]|uniref:Baculoviral IAP repeat-containing protein 6 (Apollon) n=1 Tax=Mytilus galloprovincialis TaxID=29158 RepID=A0A8B6E229_MYTGA|nr:baculoviral IAP repeat-containing protein 6 (apollon) [Mytilus galloprovincialis]